MNWQDRRILWYIAGVVVVVLVLAWVLGWPWLGGVEAPATGPATTQ